MAKQKIKIYCPILGIISLVTFIMSLYFKFIKKNNPRKDMYISLGYISSVISGLIFLDKNLSPDITISQISSNDEDLEMEVDDLD